MPSGYFFFFPLRLSANEPHFIINVYCGDEDEDEDERLLGSVIGSEDRLLNFELKLGSLRCKMNCSREKIRI